MILGSDITTWPPEWCERYEERAAIHEYEGGLPRFVAEVLARHAVRDQARQALTAR